MQARLNGSAGEWQEIANGTAIGNKWITLLPFNLSVVAVRAVVTASAAPPKLRTLSAHVCSRASTTGTCATQQDFAANGVGPRQLAGVSISGCCAACEKAPSCALFVHLPAENKRKQTCTLFNAASVGGKMVVGAVSGSPPRSASTAAHAHAHTHVHAHTEAAGTMDRSTACRIPWQQPFSGSSIWNTPLGSGAQMVSVGLGTFNTGQFHGEPSYPQNHVGRGWGMRNGAMRAVRLPKILVLTSDDFVPAQTT